MSQNLRLRVGNVDVAASANGVSGDYFNVYGMTFSEGATFNAEQLAGRAQVVVLDANSRRQLFPNKTNVVGEVILVGNMPATVIGVAEEKQSMFGSSKILRVWLPYSTISGRIMGQSWLNSITVRVKEGYDSALAEQQLERLLTLRHGKKDFFTEYGRPLENGGKDHTYSSAVPHAGGGDFAGRWRYRGNEYHAGLGDGTYPGNWYSHGGWGQSQRRAAAILIEAVLVCLVGGAMGIALSMMIAFALQIFLPGWEIGFSPVAILTAFLCSTFTGILFGWLPPATRRGWIRWMRWLGNNPKIKCQPIGLAF